MTEHNIAGGATKAESVRLSGMTMLNLGRNKMATLKGMHDKKIFLTGKEAMRLL